jgi:cell wall-associated NlpC family hydrolase
MTAPPQDTNPAFEAFSRVNIDPFSPPAMKTLVYSPDVRVLIGHGNKQYDISSDLVRITMYKKENSASTVFLTVSNKGGRYSGKITPMDRITVYMKRLSWVQVFSGYVDSGPHHQLYQGVAQIKATCTIKRLMHTWWNPGLMSSAKLFDQMSLAAASAGQGQAQFDSGLGNLLTNLLERVGGWQRQNIHVQNFPTGFYNFLAANLSANQLANNKAVEAFKHLLLGDDISGGTGRYANSSPAAGAPGPIGVGQAHYVQQIVAAADELGMGPTTAEVTTGQSIADAAATGAGGFSLDGNDKKAWEGLGETGLAIRTNAMNNDGAILGVACAMAESGLRNLANANYPESLGVLPNDGVGSDHDSVGLFQQRNFAEWGTLAQRMNPRQSARMFFQHLAQVNGWRNMDPGQAIYQVQRGGSPSYYNGFMAQAKQLVQAYREAQQGVSSTVGSAPVVGGAVSAVAGAAGVTVGPSANAVTTKAVDAATDPLGARSREGGKPFPDTEGAVMTAIEQLGKPYVWGERGPGSFDCSGLIQYSFRSIGINPGWTTQDQSSAGQSVGLGEMKRGDCIYLNDPFGDQAHVIMYLGDGMCIEAPTPGQNVSYRPLAAVNTSSIYTIRRFGENGGPDPSAPRVYPPAAGSGAPPGTGTTTGVGGGTGGTHGDQVARNLFSYIFQPTMFINDVANLWGQAGGHKDFIDAQPLLQMVQAVAGASLRNFQSAPNGDLMFYYPDYFGLEGKPAVVQLEDIELKDVHINVSDDQLATHVYVAGDYTMLGQSDQVQSWLDTAGTATVEDEWLFQRLRKVGLGEYLPTSGQDIMRRFGVRPIQRTMTMAGSHELEFMLACQIFMEKWAAQYETRCSFTFMPELLPGMRIKFGDHNLQVYVTEVVHDCDFTNGFTTSATICAPTTLNNKQLMATTDTGNSEPVAAGIFSRFNPNATLLSESLP